MAGPLNLTSHPAVKFEPEDRPTVHLVVDGQPMKAFEGQSLAAALWANGISCLRHDEATEEPRGLYCGMGHCYECRVTVDGVANVRSCLIRVREGMRVAASGMPDRDRRS